MKFVITQVILSTVLLGHVVQAAPQLMNDMQMPDILCGNARKEEFADINEEKYAGKAELVSGVKCGSLVDQTCSLLYGKTWSKATTFTAGGSAQIKFKVGSLFELQLGPSFAYSWTTMQGGVMSASVICPPSKSGNAGLQCGMAAIPQMVKITGRYLPEIPEKSTCKDEPWEDFEGHSVALKQTREETKENGANDMNDADVLFVPCLAQCETKDACREGLEQGLEVCPDTDVPMALQELFNEGTSALSALVVAAANGIRVPE